MADINDMIADLMAQKQRERLWGPNWHDAEASAQAQSNWEREMSLNELNSNRNYDLGMANNAYKISTESQKAAEDRARTALGYHKMIEDARKSPTYILNKDAVEAQIKEWEREAQRISGSGGSVDAGRSNSIATQLAGQMAPAAPISNSLYATGIVNGRPTGFSDQGAGITQPNGVWDWNSRANIYATPSANQNTGGSFYNPTQSAQPVGQSQSIGTSVNAPKNDWREMMKKYNIQ
jgi:hypothetical protein